MRRVLLFISSYIPLYILLIIKNILERCTNDGVFTFSFEKLKATVFFDEINDYAIGLLIILTIISLVYLNNIKNKIDGVHYYEIINIEDQTGNMYFNYISVYLLSCLGLSLNSIPDVFELLFVMILIGYIYITNHMTYLNPVLQFIGFKIYEGEVISKSTGKTMHSVIVAKKILELNQKKYIWEAEKKILYTLTKLIRIVFI